MGISAHDRLLLKHSVGKNGGHGNAQMEGPCCADASGGSPFVQFEGAPENGCWVLRIFRWRRADQPGFMELWGERILS